MHDLDRTLLETESSAAFPYPGELGSSEFEGPLSPAQETEFASRLLEVSNDRELEQFLGDVLKTVGRSVGRFASSDTGRAVGGLLKSAVKQVLPAAGRAVGSWVSPGGGDLGSQLATQAGQLLGLELEGLSEEDRSSKSPASWSAWRRRPRSRRATRRTTPIRRRSRARLSRPRPGNTRRACSGGCLAARARSGPGPGGGSAMARRSLSTAARPRQEPAYQKGDVMSGYMSEAEYGNTNTRANTRANTKGNTRASTASKGARVACSVRLRRSGLLRSCWRSTTRRNSSNSSAA